MDHNNLWTDRINKIRKDRELEITSRDKDAERILDQAVIAVDRLLSPRSGELAVDGITENDLERYLIEILVIDENYLNFSNPRDWALAELIKQLLREKGSLIEDEPLPLDTVKLITSGGNLISTVIGNSQYNLYLTDADPLCQTAAVTLECIQLPYDEYETVMPEVAVGLTLEPGAVIATPDGVFLFEVVSIGLESMTIKLLNLPEC